MSNMFEIKASIEWPTFCKRHFAMYFFERKSLESDLNSNGICSHVSNMPTHDSGNVLSQSRSKSVEMHAFFQYFCTKQSLLLLIFTNGYVVFGQLKVNKAQNFSYTTQVCTKHSQLFQACDMPANVLAYVDVDPFIKTHSRWASAHRGTLCLKWITYSSGMDDKLHLV